MYNYFSSRTRENQLAFIYFRPCSKNHQEGKIDHSRKNLKLLLDYLGLKELNNQVLKKTHFKNKQTKKTYVEPKREPTRMTMPSKREFSYSSPIFTLPRGPQTAFIEWEERSKMLQLESEFGYLIIMENRKPSFQNWYCLWHLETVKLLHYLLETKEVIRSVPVFVQEQSKNQLHSLGLKGSQEKRNKNKAVWYFHPTDYSCSTYKNLWKTKSQDVNLRYRELNLNSVI